MNTLTIPAIPGIGINRTAVPPRIFPMPKPSKQRTIEELIEGDAYESWSRKEYEFASAAYKDICNRYKLHTTSDYEDELLPKLQELIEMCLAHEQGLINVVEQNEANSEFEKFGDPSLSARARNGGRL